ncbi:MAG: DUF6265 family protein [Aggregatilineales bacterium]
MTKFPTSGVTNATPADFPWMIGKWRGSHGTYGEDTVEEHWSEPGTGGTMMGMFRWEKPDGVWFYELLVIEQNDAEVFMRLKHFNPGLKGWEEKDEATEFLLVQLDYRRAVFLQMNKRETQWLIYRLEGENRLVSYFEKEDAFPDEAQKFIFQRLP